MSKGCGCERGLLRYIKPPFAKLFYVSCCIHDDDYDRGGNRHNRKSADVSLYRNMGKIISAKDCSPWKSFCYTSVALAYYSCVRLFGRFYFNYT